MRTYQVILSQNLGPIPGPGASLDVSAHVVSIGPWSFIAEKELTRMSASEQAITLEDGDGSIWSWMQEHVPTPDWGYSPNFTTNSYPLIVSIFIADDLKFTGFAPPRQISRDEATRAIQLSAADWSSQLANKYLGAPNIADDLNPEINEWMRPWPRILQSAAGTSQTCHLCAGSATPGGYDSIWWNGNKFIIPGSLVTVSGLAGMPSGVSYKVRSVTECTQYWSYTSNSYIANSYMAQIEGLGQAIYDLPSTTHTGTIGGIQERSATFTTGTSATSVTDHFLVTEAVPANTKGAYKIKLNTVDGLHPGDFLKTINAESEKTWEILTVNGATLTVTTKEEVEDITTSTKLWWTDESAAELVLQDARVLIERAVTSGAAGYGVDFSQLTSTQLSSSIFQWLPLDTKGSVTMSSIVDMEPNLSEIKLFGSIGTWIGTPETGWVTGPDATKHVDWTAQQLSAPSSLMPLDMTLAPNGRMRNSSKTIIVRASARDEGNRAYDNGVDYPVVTVVYDYTNMRRIVISKANKDAANVVKIRTWSGSAWGTESTFTWASTSPVWSASVVPGASGKIAILEYLGVKIVDPTTGTGTDRYIPSRVYTDDGELVTTPWGLYLCASAGYIKLTYTAGSPGSVTGTAIRLASMDSLYPSTFVGLSPTECLVIGRFKGVNTAGASSIETWILKLDANPTTADLAVLSKERLQAGIATTCAAIRHPGLATGVVGHCSGALWSYGTVLSESYVVERFTPGGMKAAELIEHICQILCAIAVPDAKGTLHIISRNRVTSGTPLAVERTSATTTHTWEHFYSLVRVSSAKDEGIYGDSTGAAGGDVFEISQHPLIFTESGCKALASMYRDWVGVPRRCREEQWFHSDPDTASPWENLPPLACVTLPGDSTVWMIISIEDDRLKGTANVKLIEVYV